MIHAKSILALSAAGTAIVDKAFREASDPYITGTSTKPMPPRDVEWKPNPTEEPVGWTYLGSSNFTRAAHGNISGTVNRPTMSCSNWEL